MAGEESGGLGRRVVGWGGVWWAGEGEEEGTREKSSPCLPSSCLAWTSWAVLEQVHQQQRSFWPDVIQQLLEAQHPAQSPMVGCVSQQQQIGWPLQGSSSSSSSSSSLAGLHHVLLHPLPRLCPQTRPEGRPAEGTGHEGLAAVTSLRLRTRASASVPRHAHPSPSRRTASPSPCRGEFCRMKVVVVVVVVAAMACLLRNAAHGVVREDYRTVRADVEDQTAVSLIASRRRLLRAAFCPRREVSALGLVAVPACRPFARCCAGALYLASVGCHLAGLYLDVTCSTLVSILRCHSFLFFYVPTLFMHILFSFREEISNNNSRFEKCRCFPLLESYP